MKKSDYIFGKKNLDDYELFYQPHDYVATQYYQFWKNNGRNTSFFPFIQETEKHFLSHYILTKEFFKHLQPFQFLKSNDHAVQVGFHDQYLDLGVSQPLIISSIVGNNGNVIAFDPDPINIEKIKSYCFQNNISNIKIKKIGVMNKKGKEKFVFFSDFSSSNTAIDVFENCKEMISDRWKSRITEKSRTVTVDVDSLNNLLTEKIDFLNITANGAEAEVLEGATKLLKNENICIAFPLVNMSKNGLDMLQNSGFKITIADAPHRPWESEQFFYACAVKKTIESLSNMGFRKVTMSEEINPSSPFTIYKIKN